MLALARKNKIRDIVFEKKSVTVSQLAKKFSVTEETIRRDLKTLEDAGVLTRTYGGAFIQDGVINDISVSVREDILVPNKKIIAKECGKLIKNGDTISIDASTTAFQICDEIKTKRITVLTHSIAVINLLKEFDNISLIATGGVVIGKNQFFAGKTARENISEYFVDKAFISCRTIDMQNGVTEASEELAEIRRTFIERADKAYLLADHTKFDRTSFIKICDFNKLAGVVVDRPLSLQWQSFLKKSGVELHEPSAPK